MKKLLSIDRLFPPEAIAERKALLERFWSGEDIGRPAVMASGGAAGAPAGADLETVARCFAAALEARARVPWDFVPCFSCYTYPVALASAFGGRLVTSPDSNPWIEPVVRTARDVERVAMPPVLSGLVGEGVRRYEYVLERIDGYVPPSGPDMQSPLMTASMLWKQEDFLLAMYDAPEAVHRLLDIVTEYMISVYAHFLDTYPGAMAVGYPPCYMPQRMGVGLIEDFMHLLPAALYEEFGLPYVNRIADRFGGLLVHCCGVFEQHWDTVKRFRNLRGLDTQYPYSRPERVMAAFPGVVHSMTLDYAERQRNFPAGDPDAFLKFLLPRIPAGVRWQIYLDAGDIPSALRQMDLVRSARGGRR